MSLLFLATIGLMSTGRDDVASQRYFDLGAKYPAVGRVDGQFVSGTLIGRRWVITAAHLGVRGRGRVFLGGEEIAVEEWIVHPQFSGDPMNGFDFALGRLSRDVTHVAPIPYSTMSAVGLIGVSVGFGVEGKGSTGPKEGTGGVCRAFRNRIDAQDPVLDGRRYPFYLADFDRPDGGANTLASVARLTSGAKPLDLEGCASNQDSGGALLVVRKGRPVLVGVTSSVISLNRGGGALGRYGDWTAWSPVDTVADWIQRTTKIAPVR